MPKQVKHQTPRFALFTTSKESVEGREKEGLMNAEMVFTVFTDWLLIDLEC